MFEPFATFAAVQFLMLGWISVLYVAAERGWKFDQRRGRASRRVPGGKRTTDRLFLPF